MAAAAYHSKALPPGATLREWVIEDVLGAGGFAIVYRAKNIYFGDSVAIKEYFPSGITDRVEGVTVTPMDSGSEEAYRYGLKKFVDEAKILWNLSRPERHPNLISVRSLFEINGTAYIVMDYELGQPLSRQLRQGRKFDEHSLWHTFYPILQGLERAHKAGVYHRDIKPANILVDQNDHSVLIDFGSARFETAKGTHTRLTFYTPPYAAIEQYVKSLPTGPWTDIYALGVTLYQCITGKKPAEATDRSFSSKGETLAAGEWPGFSPGFLRWVDRAMAVHPNERPQSLSEWVALRKAEGTEDAVAASPQAWQFRQDDDGEDEKTDGQEVQEDDDIPEPLGLRAGSEEEQVTVLRPMQPATEDATRISLPPARPEAAPVPPVQPGPRKFPLLAVAGGLAALLVAAGIGIFALRPGPAQEPQPQRNEVTQSAAPRVIQPAKIPASVQPPAAVQPPTEVANPGSDPEVAAIRASMKEILGSLTRQSSELAGLGNGVTADGRPQAAADLKKLRDLASGAHDRVDQAIEIATGLPKDADISTAKTALQNLKSANDALQANLNEARRLRQGLQNAASDAAIRQWTARNQTEQAQMRQAFADADKLVSGTAAQADKLPDRDSLLAPLHSLADQIHAKSVEAENAGSAIDSAANPDMARTAYDRAAAARQAAQSLIDRLRTQNTETNDKINLAKQAAKAAPAATPAAPVAAVLPAAPVVSACQCPADMSARRCAEWKAWNCK